jgi:hypothetical protein
MERVNVYDKGVPGQIGSAFSAAAFMKHFRCSG